MTVRSLGRRSRSAALPIVTAFLGATAASAEDRAERTRRVLAPTLLRECEIATDLRDGNQTVLRTLAKAMQRDLSAGPTRCDAALDMMSAMAHEAGRGARLPIGDTPEDMFPVRTIATSIGHCEDDAGAPRSARLLTVGFIKSY